MISYAIRNALETLGDSGFDEDIRRAAIAELEDLERDCEGYRRCLEELLLYARGNDVVLGKIRTALGIGL